MTDIFKGLGYECFTSTKKFHIIKNELSRIGFASNKKLYQTAHIFQKQQKYSIFHFKELFAFDDKYTDIDPDDIERRNIIVGYLLTKDLISIEHDYQFLSNYVDVSTFGFNDHQFFVELGSDFNLTFLPESRGNEWQLIPKYTFGNKFRSLSV